MVIVAMKMEDAVDEITGEFAAKGDIVPLAVFGGHGRADEEFTIKSIGFRIIEGDNVRRAFVLQMRFINFSHALCGNKGDRQVVGRGLE